MKYEVLLANYEALILENGLLKKENQRLKAQLGISEEQVQVFQEATKDHSTSAFLTQYTESSSIFAPDQINQLTPMEKIKLYMSLFKGREDVYAKRWENDKKGTSGYAPFCLNEWQAGICAKPKGKCADCTQKAYAALIEKVIEEHLRGNIVAGIYPMCLDETCYFLAIDFDDKEWQKDIAVLRKLCREFDVTVAVERSRSGNGCHAWFFFEDPVPAALARKFGAALLTCAMSKRHELSFQSYDRFFPSQDTMPKGGLGNLIALPLQKAARRDGNSVFINENFEAYEDQWGFLAAVGRLSEEQATSLTSRLCHGNELGVLKKDEEEGQKPWETSTSKLLENDFPQDLVVVKANMLFIPEAGISQSALDQLKRLAAFKNPEFYKAQAMRMSTFNKPRIIYCADETSEYLCLPRGCEADLKTVFKQAGVNVCFNDKTNHGNIIDVEFKGSLRDEQPLALSELLSYDNGVLSGTTAFGKTVVAIKLIAERKVNTLIVVDRVNLVSQWRKRLTEFLTINETITDADDEKKRGRKKAQSIVGQIGAGQNNLHGVIDIAVMQSLNRMGEVNECMRNYGMIIIDECHHVSAFSFEMILKNSHAKYVYGLTATPIRKDGHHPIIFMQCGPIRYKDDAKKQAERRPFEHYIIPRFTSLRIPLDKDEKEISIQELYSEIVINEMRNQLIVDDVVKNYENGRNCIVLTERTAHVELLTKSLSHRIPDVISLTGGMGAKEIREKMLQITDAPRDKQLTLVATGKFIGEGFDAPRLDTLFLAMPISWKGTLQQYAGRLHRLFENKTEVQIYDYIDVHVRMLEKMYNKRLSGYASIGYKAKGEGVDSDAIDIIFDKQSFLPVYCDDIINADREIIVVSPFISKKRTIQMLQYFSLALSKNVKVIVVTRPPDDLSQKNQSALHGALDLLKTAGVRLAFKANIHQKFAIMDQRLVWYGSINLLSFGHSEESMMRLDSPHIANKLIKSIEKQRSDELFCEN
jgi:superfamily II DNA or RNA helicase